MTTWADRITALEDLGWTLTAIARAIRLSPQAVSDIKQGRTDEPRGMVAVRLHRLHADGQPPQASVDQAA